MSELLPCPFCASTMDDFAGMTPEAFSKCSDGTLSVNCECGVIGPSGATMEEAVDRWNSRAFPQKAPIQPLKGE